MKTIKSQGVRRLSIALIFLTALLFMSGASLAAPTDIEGHWAGNTIAKWVDEGNVKGYEDGTFRPNNPITRAEFMVLVNNAFGFSKEAELDFTDVAADAWYASHVAKAKAGVYISGYPDGTVRPGANITRQEVAVVIANLKNLADNEKAAGSFNDANLVPDWSKGAIGAVLGAGYMSGYPDNTFKPANNITRAEALVALDNLPDTVVYDQVGTYGPAEGEEAVNADVIINEDGVVLQNFAIDGDLTIGEGVGSGTVTLNNITVKGETFVRGGGTDSIVINGGSYNKIIILKTSSGAVRIVATDAKGMDVVLAEDAGGDTVVLEGTFDSVTVDAPEVVVETRGETVINSMVVTENSKGVTINLDKGTTVTKLVKEVEVKVKGEGEVKETVEPKEAPKEESKKDTGGTGGSGSSDDPGGHDGPSKPPITVSGIKIYDSNNNVIGIGKDLSGVIDDSTRLKKITFTVNTSPTTLTITGVVSPRTTVTNETKTKTFSSQTCEITVDDLLDSGQTSVSLGTLRSIFGEYIQVQGTLTAAGYNAYTTPIRVELAGDTSLANEWVDVSYSGDTITAKIKSGKGGTLLKEIGIGNFLQYPFDKLPSAVKIGNNDWIDVPDGDYASVKNEIKGQLAELGNASDWEDENFMLSSLADKSIKFKLGDTEYTLEIVN
jgi:hypothetical protein